MLAKLPLATEQQLEIAINAALSGFKTLSNWSAGKRSSNLHALAALIRRDQDSLAELIVHEAGKPISYAKNEIARCITTVETAASETLRFGGEIVPIDFAAGEGKSAFTKRFPIGPIACITPFNFPLNLVLHKVAPALAVGCTVIIKPAPQAPLSALALASLISELDYPKGAVNVLACDIPTAEKLVTNPSIAMLSFTGSEKVGWHLKNKVGRKKVTLELGGNAAVIIDESAELNKAAKAVAAGAYIYSGQICISTQRIFVVEKVYEQFLTLLLTEIQELKSGDPSDPKVLVGPIIDVTHLNRIETWVKDAISAGAKVLIGGEILSKEHNIFEPTLLTDTTADMKVASEEVFGPVAVIEKVRDFNEAIDRTNDSDFGLQAGVFTNSFEHVKAAHDKLEVGGIMINNIPGFRVDSMPYGGVKGSGYGREGIKYAMEEMTEPRLLVY
ncbi:MAG: aldehyde dehydrogenase family protein [Bdellovibrionota bacterium]